MEPETWTPPRRKRGKPLVKSKQVEGGVLLRFPLKSWLYDGDWNRRLHSQDMKAIYYRASSFARWRERRIMRAVFGSLAVS